jgi:predicted nucleic acid-binding Zn ribbon protein
MPKISNEFSLAQAIECFLQENQLKDRLFIHRIKNNWADVAGAVVAEQTEKVWFHKGVLYIQLKNPVWKNELFYLREQIKAAVNEQAGKSICQEVKVF